MIQQNIIFHAMNNWIKQTKESENSSLNEQPKKNGSNNINRNKIKEPQFSNSMRNEYNA